MKSLRVRIFDTTGCFLGDQKKYYNMPRDQLFKFFLPQQYQYVVVSIDEPADICLYSIQLSDKNLLRRTELNILICVENCYQWYWYNHYNKYGNYGNEMTDVYVYNHIHKLASGQYPLTVSNNCADSSSYVAIPMIHLRINYFLDVVNQYRTMSSLNVPFSNKKFCLMTNKSNLNSDINKIVSQLSKIGTVDNINMYNNKIENVTCYNGIELLEVYGQYKFVMCIENSYGFGYITEKIFNAFLAGSVPIYSGSPIVGQFLNTDSFVNIFLENENNNPEVEQKILDEFCQKIQELNTDEKKYIDMINQNKINNQYNNENYKDHFNTVFTKRFDST